MQVGRIFRHLFTSVWSVQRAFPTRALAAIEEATRAGEQTHRGQVRFAVEHSLDPVDLLRGETARERAIDVFSQLRIWDTEHNNGVLIYLLLADRDVEIVADRGIHAKVGADGWEAICRAMEAAFRQGEFESGVVRGVRAVSEHLQRHYPAQGATPNELPDRPVVL